MPKEKTRKSAAKRFKLTGTGKLMRRQSGQKHLLAGKTSKRIRSLKGEKDVSDGDLKRVSDQLPYTQYLR